MILAYLRVSSDKQDVAAQRGAIEEYCKFTGVTVNSWREIEISSRKSMEDRGIDGLITELSPGDVLIVSEISRLARSVGEVAIICERLLDKKIRLICIKERIDLIKTGKDLDIQSLVMITMFGLFAQIERSLISIRTKEGLAVAKAKGKKLGNPHPEIGAATVKKQAEDFSEPLRPIFTEMKGLPARRIAEHLNERGILSRTGGKWSQSSVQRVVGRLNNSNFEGTVQHLSTF